ncbi:Lacal_2735 family protein [Aureitalea marina]|uniref:Lacal_2735 family protein n=1 Tax=Aureitalea marina TaxID=930804 RepID=UPI000CF2C968|nr:Lacal_2735 family protein [Aureitalea marina]
MPDWFRRRSRLEKLEKQYTYLMRQSFEQAARDQEKSIWARQEADKIYAKIKELGLKRS